MGLLAIHLPACCLEDRPLADGERVVSYVWRCFSTARVFDDVWVELQKPYRYGYKAYPHPQYRGRDLRNAVSYYSGNVCAAHGYTHDLALIEPHNFASISSARRRVRRPA